MISQADALRLDRLESARALRSAGRLHRTAGHQPSLSLFCTWHASWCLYARVRGRERRRCWLLLSRLLQALDTLLWPWQTLIRGARRRLRRNGVLWIVAQEQARQPDTLTRFSQRSISANCRCPSAGCSPSAVGSGGSAQSRAATGVSSCGRRVGKAREAKLPLVIRRRRLQGRQLRKDASSGAGRSASARRLRNELSTYR